MTKKNAVEQVLRREDPGRFIYAPNYWQWFTHQKNHKLQVEDNIHCQTQLDCIRSFDQDVFSRNIYSNPYDYWFGGLSEKVYDHVSVEKTVEMRGPDTITTFRYSTPAGVLEERLRYVFAESTLVQEKYLVDNPDTQLSIFKDLINRTAFRYIPDSYKKVEDEIGNDGIAVAGEFFSPLKMLHIYFGQVEATYLLVDHEEQIKPLLDIHEKRQLALLQEMLDSGIRVFMAMDNLDSMFHPPHYVEKYSASFYEKASALCHNKDANFFIHACGQQKANLKLISSLGVDGLEGVAYPPLGDVQLEEAMELSSDRFIITGGVSAAETVNMTTRDEVFRYVDDLLKRMKPYRHRFMLSASCNTAIETPWEILKYFNEAWQELGK